MRAKTPEDVRVRGRIGLLGVAALLLVPVGATGDRPLPLEAPVAATAPLTAIAYRGNGFRLAQVDDATLALGRASDHVAGYAGGWLRAPGGALLAVAVGTTTPPGSTLRFVRPATLEWRPGGVPLDGFFRSGLWPAAGRLVAVVDGATRATAETVDVAAQAVVARRPLAGIVVWAERSSQGLVVLLQPARKIGPAWLAAIAADGSVRSVQLRRILAGTSWKRRGRGNEMIGTMRRPGLAVDPASDTAYVVDPSGLVASIDLRTLAVAYHRTARSALSRLGAWLTPAAEAKGLNGPTRRAQWLGDDLIAITGIDQTVARQRSGGLVFSGRAAGLTILDTRDWHVRTLDPRANAATVADGMLLASGSSWRSGPLKSTSTAEGLAAYGADGALRWRLGEGGVRWVGAAYGSLVLVGRPASDAYDVVDLQSGKVLRAGVDGPVPQLLLGAGS